MNIIDCMRGRRKGETVSSFQEERKRKKAPCFLSQSGPIKEGTVPSFIDDTAKKTGKHKRTSKSRKDGTVPSFHEDTAAKTGKQAKKRTVRFFAEDHLSRIWETSKAFNSARGKRDKVSRIWETSEALNSARGNLATHGVGETAISESSR